VFLPEQLFDTGGTGADLWILVAQKDRLRRGSVVVVDARTISPGADGTTASDGVDDARQTIIEITHLVRDALELSGDDRVLVKRNEAFGHFDLTIERPLRLIWRLDEAALDALSRSDEWRAFLALRSNAGVANPLDFFYELIGLRRHHLAITWDTAKACSKDLRGSMGGHADVALAKLLVAAAATKSEEGVPQPSATRAGFESDPTLRTHAQVPMPFGYLGMSPLGQREAKSRAAKAYMSVATQKHSDAWVDGSKTLVGYAIPSAPD
jgi:type I restriction enzyme M protein